MKTNFCVRGKKPIHSNDKLEKNICNSYHSKKLISLVYKEMEKIDNPRENWVRTQRYLKGKEKQIAFNRR